MAKKNKKKRSTANRTSVIVLVLAFVVIVVTVIVAVFSQQVSLAPPAARTVPQRPGIVDIPPVSASVRDSEGSIRNIMAAVALDIDERQVRNYDVDELRTIVMGVMMQMEDDMFEQVYDLDSLSLHLREHLNMIINPDHLFGVYITEIESGEFPIARDTPQDERPRGATWQMN